MNGIFFASDIEMITTFSILSIILLLCIFIFQLTKYSPLRENPEIKSIFEKLSYLFIVYIFILQGGILYHINYIKHSLSGSESIITEESHNLVSFIMLIVSLISILTTCISVFNNKKNKLRQEEINLLEYTENP
tara:strand:+ start:1590 stop:1991 length:402 start_codon:yes stop_codon:yes gene_type:complete